MTSPIDLFYLNQDEPTKSCLLALKERVLSLNPEITQHWKYSMPFFYYRGKMFCYLWVHKKYKQPYLGIVEGKRIDHPDLIIEKRSRMKIMLFDPAKDLPIDSIKMVLEQALSFYR